MVDKERKQDLGSPEEEALEQRVREMMDVSVPDAPKEPEPTATPDKKVVSISITHDDDAPTKPGPKPKKAKTKSEVAAAAESINEQLAQEVGGASTAPLLEETPTAKPKKITVAEHVDEPTSAPEVPTEPVEEVVAEETSVEETSLETEEVPVDETPELEAEIEPEVEAEPASKAPDEPELDQESPLEAAIESPETDKAVADIIASESDELLDVSDAKTAQPLPPAPKKKSKKRRGFLRRWFGNPVTRWLTIVLVIGGSIAAGVIPTSRYFILNKAGVTSSASIIITDQTTFRPLKNVDVSIAGQSAKTDEEGMARLTKLPLGPSKLTIQKRAFASVNKEVVLGWGSNPLETVNLKAEGDQRSIIITDAFSGQPIADVQAQAGEADAISNDKGELILTIDPGDEQKIDIVFKADGYRTETVALVLSTKDKLAVKLVPDRAVAFVSKRTGKYGVYKIDADGKNESLVLAGTGKENDQIVLAAHPLHSVAALISTRDGTRADNGALLKTLTLINLKDNSNKSVISVPDIRLVDWVGTRLIYAQLTTAGYEDPARYKLMSYDFVSGDNRQLAAANYFNSVVVLQGVVIYSPASAYQNGINVGVFSVKPDGTKKQSILDKEAWNLLRVDHNELAIPVQQDWYKYISGGKPEKLPGQPSDMTPRIYTDSPDGKYSVWLDMRDGKGTILLHNTVNKDEKAIVTASGVKSPIRWLSNTTLVYRVANSKETADYVVDITGGELRKIVDVTDAAGIDRWTF